jgi:hypothetical protein
MSSGTSLAGDPLGAASCYTYDQLPAGKWFRILRLLPGLFQDPVSFELITTELSKAPSYEPISYCWGDSNSVQETICDGFPFFITTNLFQALRRFRLENEERLLWADACCINQRSLKERGQQVAYMGDIYVQGKRTLVWLNEKPEENDAQDAITLIQYFNEWAQDEICKMEMHKLGTEDILQELSRIPQLPEGHPLLSRTTGWRTCCELLLCPWFGRVWVIQEVGLSKSMILHWGESQLEMCELMRFLTVISTSQEKIRSIFDLNVWTLYNLLISVWSTFAESSSWMDSHWLLAEIKRYCCSDQGMRLTFADILYDCLDFGATETQDHIYALLGHRLAKKRDGKSSITDPDYTRPAHEPSLLLAQALCLEQNSLSPLCYVQTKTLRPQSEMKETECPSWVTRWDEERVYARSPPHPRFDASLSLETAASVVIEVIGKQLRTNGFLVEKVMTCSESFDASDVEFEISSHGESSKHFVESCWDMLVKSEPSDITANLTVLVRTLIGFSYSRPELTILDFIAYCKKHCSNAFNDVIASKSDLMVAFQSSEGVSSARFTDRLIASVHSRKFFISESGNAGLGLRPTEPGDIVAILFGCPMPVLLRHNYEEKTFQFVGPCIFQGSMLGELARMWKNSESYYGRPLEAEILTLV